jgi:hypothetical protein
MNSISGFDQIYIEQYLIETIETHSMIGYYSELKVFSSKVMLHFTPGSNISVHTVNVH